MGTVGAVVAVTSARPDGATSVAVGLAAVMSRSARTLLVDLNLDSPEIGALLDLPEAGGIYHLAHGARLETVSERDLAQQVVRREGLACLTGVADPIQREAVTAGFVRELVGAARDSFELVVIDLGRLHPDLPEAAIVGAVLVAVTPSPLGLAAIDRAHRRLDDARPAWLERLAVVLTRTSSQTVAGVEEFLPRQFGLSVVGAVPDAPSFWRRVEYEHSVRALLVPVDDERRYAASYGADALPLRRGFERLAAALVPAAAAEEARVGA